MHIPRFKKRSARQPGDAADVPPGDPAVVAAKLSLHSPLGPADVEALRDMLGRSQAFADRAIIAQAGEPADMVTVLGRGIACRMTMLPSGRRQIQAVLLPGDVADGETSLLLRRSDNIEALTACSVWIAPRSRLAALPRTAPGLATAFMREAAINAEVARQWVVNLGARNARERVAHLLCEVTTRMDALNLAVRGAYPLPITQQDIGDATGLSSVHVNRVLQSLRSEGLIHTSGRALKVLDRERLCAIAAFDQAYLHMEQAAAA